MESDEIRNQLQDIFRTTFEDTTLEISDEMTAADYEKWDSLSHIQLIIATETHFGVRFSNAEIARLDNVGDLVNLIASK